MGKIQDLWNKTYAPTKEQQAIIGDILESCTFDEAMALSKFGTHMYAEGWKDYMLPFVGTGLVVGILIGRVTKR